MNGKRKGAQVNTTNIVEPKDRTDGPTGLGPLDTAAVSREQTAERKNGRRARRSKGEEPSRDQVSLFPAGHLVRRTKNSLL